MVNQCGETLTEGSVSVSDVVSITAEGLILFCEVAFLAILQRGLNGVGHQKSLVRCANVLTTVMGLGVVYAILGKFSLLYYGTEDLPDLLDWTAFSFPFVLPCVCVRCVCVGLFPRFQQVVRLSSLCATCGIVSVYLYCCIYMAGFA